MRIYNLQFTFFNQFLSKMNLRDRIIFRLQLFRMNFFRRVSIFNELSIYKIFSLDFILHLKLKILDLDRVKRGNYVL